MIKRTEYPRPQLVRKDWICLNGTWDFSIDASRSGAARGMASAEAEYERSIEVPFCPESVLSGVGVTDFMQSVWYRRAFTLPENWQGGRILLHIGACDYETEIYCNGTSLGTHRGGYVSFSAELTQHLHAGENLLVIHASDDTRSPLQPTGKQCEAYASEGCFYTRTTGIWQTVWLEKLPGTYLKNIDYLPDPENGQVTVRVTAEGPCGGAQLQLQASYEGRACGTASGAFCGQECSITLPLSETHLWEPGHGRLYDLHLILSAPQSRDCADSYFGLRTVSLENGNFCVNGRPVFLRTVLDQGFYPDGIYTAPDDAALAADVQRSMALGFNGARLHEKIFEERFLYHADRAGYLVFSEFPNWGADISRNDGLFAVLPEWTEEILRDRAHPAVIGWCPFNETWDSAGNGYRRQKNEILAIVYQITKALDPARPVIDTSGNYHVVTDIYDVHDYEQNVEAFAAHYAAMRTGGQPFETFTDRQKYNGQPYFVSEFGGIRYAPGQPKGWGYGSDAADEADFYRRFEGLVSTLLSNPRVCGFCYTQLTDVEQEQNGLYTYDRQSKFDTERICKILSAPAAAEAL